MFDLLIPDDRQVCWSESTMHSDLLPDGRIAVIQFNAEPLRAQSVHDATGFVGVAFGDGQHMQMRGTQPSWESTPEMLDQDTNEAFHAPERCAMDHDGSMSTTIGSDVPEIEPFREIVIHLNRPELPLASDDILHDEIDLRAVECGLSSPVSYTHLTLPTTPYV